MGSTPNPKLSSPSLDRFGEYRVQANRQCVFISSVLILLNVSARPPATSCTSVPWQLAVCPYVILLSEARRVSSLLCSLVTNFSHSSQGTALLLGTAD